MRHVGREVSFQQGDEKGHQIDYLKEEALAMLCCLMEHDESVGVQLLKINLLSNLLLSTLQDRRQSDDDGTSQYELIIQDILRCAVNNSYRERLLAQSVDFRKERERLTKISKDQRLVMSE